jgi:cytochrome c554/c'-like protein
VLAVALLFAAVPPSEYAGAAACQGCHPAEYAAQSATAHAASLERSRPGQPGDWAFGAGSQAITFVSRVDAEYYLEHGESWYAKPGGYARTPGHRAAGGVRFRIFDPSAGILRCFSCHSTGPVTLGSGNAIVPHEQGVRCEDCHGPAAAHARDPGRVRPLNPARLSGAEINDLCGTCHRMPMGAAATPDLRDPWNARHQPLLLAASACFQRGGGRLSCLTCHAPHTAVERNQPAYDAACARCHAAPRHRTPVAGRPCVACHMPTVKPNAGLSFANHRIAIYRPEDPLTPQAKR